MNKKLIISLILLLSLSLQFFMFIKVGDVYNDDSAEYLGRAENLLNGEQWFHSERQPWRFPVYIFSICFVSLFLKDVWASAIVISVLSTLSTIVLIYLISKEIYSEREGIIAAALAAIFSTNVYFGYKIMTESIFLFVFLLSFYFLVLYQKRGNHKYLWSSVLLSSFASLIRLEAGAILVVYMLVLIHRTLKKDASRKDFTKIVLKAAFLFSIPWLIWCLRIWAVYGNPFYQLHFVFLIGERSFKSLLDMELPTLILVLIIPVIVSLLVSWQNKFEKDGILVLTTFVILIYEISGFSLAPFSPRYMLLFFNFFIMYSSSGIIHIKNTLSDNRNLIISILLIIGLSETIFLGFFPLKAWFLPEQEILKMDTAKYIKQNSFENETVIVIGHDVPYGIEYFSKRTSFYMQLPPDTLGWCPNQELMDCLEMRNVRYIVWFSSNLGNWIVPENSFISGESIYEVGDLRVHLSQYPFVDSIETSTGKIVLEPVNTLRYQRMIPYVENRNHFFNVITYEINIERK